MELNAAKQLHLFRNEVGLRFQLYNSLFTSLPFHRIENTGVLLTLLAQHCDAGFSNGQSPTEILDSFFEKHTTLKTEEHKVDLLFRFTQYAERQVVLFDALEDAAFKMTHDLHGAGTMKQIESEVIQDGKEKELAKKLKDFSIRLVLTAHPTQFYPDTVLGIIIDLAKALEKNDSLLINTLLQQLGKTPFFKKQKPTPYDEAMSLIWYLENIFYPAAGKVISTLKNSLPQVLDKRNAIIRLGFWPGGDRDGNPFVNTLITLRVAQELRTSILACYYKEVRRLKRRLTFSGIEHLLQGLERKLYENVFIPGIKTNITKGEIIRTLTEIKQIINEKHNGLFAHKIDVLIDKIEIFGLHFASLDIRQDSSVHRDLMLTLTHMGGYLPTGYATLNDKEKMQALAKISTTLTPDLLQNPIEQDTIRMVSSIKEIHEFNGEDGCHRYIISQCNSAVNAMEVYALFLLTGWKPEQINMDIVPLFETIDDLHNASAVMKLLYSNSTYRNHLKNRENRQTIMLGFSDGTKDGGYLMANWSIYKAKEALTAISRKYDIDVVFFDGRGGPPSRGGGKTHKFYASLGKTISNKEIQLTIQGQTVTSSFGTVEAAQFNMEQLLNAGISNDLFPRSISFSKKEKGILDTLSQYGFDAYKQLRDHPHLTDYLMEVSPLRFYSQTNIGSRPAKRGAASGLTLKDLRAIPFAGSWSQLKQNVTGFYGVGSALKKMEEEGKFAHLQKLYKYSLFFKTLIDNCEMAMLKSFFPLTAYLQKHKKYGPIWNMIHNEYELSKEYIFKLTGHTELMANYPVDQLSVQMRERIIKPVLTIQQYALTRIRDKHVKDTPIQETYEKLAMRCSFGIINAGRNSA